MQRGYLLTSDGAIANEAVTHTAAAALMVHFRRASAKPLPCRRPLTSAPSRHHKPCQTCYRPESVHDGW